MSRKNKVSGVVSDTMVNLDSMIAPDEMNKQDAVKVLEVVIQECRDRIECLLEEIAAEDE